MTIKWKEYIEEQGSWRERTEKEECSNIKGLKDTARTWASAFLHQLDEYNPHSRHQVYVWWMNEPLGPLIPIVTLRHTSYTYSYLDSKMLKLGPKFPMNSSFLSLSVFKWPLCLSSKLLWSTLQTTRHLTVSVLQMRLHLLLASWP